MLKALKLAREELDKMGCDCKTLNEECSICMVRQALTMAGYD